MGMGAEHQQALRPEQARKVHNSGGEAGGGERNTNKVQRINPDDNELAIAKAR